LEFDSASNVLPMAGTYKTVSAIDTAIAAINEVKASQHNANLYSSTLPLATLLNGI